MPSPDLMSYMSLERHLVVPESKNYKPFLVNLLMCLTLHSLLSLPFCSMILKQMKNCEVHSAFLYTLFCPNKLCSTRSQVTYVISFTFCFAGVGASANIYIFRNSGLTD